MEVNFKEAVGLYILLKKSESPLPTALNRLAIRIEKMLNEELSLSQLQNIEDYFDSLED